MRRALAICDKIFGPSSAVRGIALNGLSGVLIYTGRYADAESTLSEALKLNKKWPNPDNANVGISLNNFGCAVSAHRTVRQSRDGHAASGGDR